MFEDIDQHCVVEQRLDSALETKKTKSIHKLNLCRLMSFADNNAARVASNLFLIGI